MNRQRPRAIQARLPRTRKPATPGRTSLACTICRQRKVKCSGDWPSCKSCLRRSDSCEYPGLETYASVSSPVEAQETTLESQETPAGDARPADDSAGGLPPHDVLTEAAEKFLASYGEFPFWFLRRHVFMEELARGLVPSCLLFCILSNVARFVEPCYKMYGGTIEASVYFASLAREYISKMHDEISLLNVHCNLILSLYDLGHGDEHRAWLRLGIATRICQALGLPFESQYDDDDSITAESKRRTFWSCYAMERLLVNGRDRPLHVPSSKINTCLPTSAVNFIIGRVGQISTLPAEPSPTDTLQAFTIRITDLLSRIVEWGGAGIGGRHEDPRSPWLEDMPFSRLQKELQHWRSCLPPYLALSSVNIRAHVEAGEGKLFGLMHLFYMTAGVRLYRKYLPFIPPPSYDPTFDGPYDGPELIPGPNAPGFWGEITRLGVRYAVGITAAFMQLGEQGLDPWLTPLLGLPLVESSTMLIFITHAEWESCQEFVGQPAKNMLADNLNLLIKMQENWPVAAFWVKSLRLFYERVSLSQNAVIASDDSNQPPVWTLKEAMLHFNRSDREKEGLPPYLPRKEHDLFSLLEEEQEGTGNENE